MAAARPDASHRLRRAARIRQSSEIREILRAGRRRRTGNFEIIYRPSRAAEPRFGMIVPKHRHNSVQRNLLRRRIREVARTVLLPLLRASECAVDVLVRAGASAYDLGFTELKRELESIAPELCSSVSS